jgi:Flp pilus assembly pilin Flp
VNGGARAHIRSGLRQDDGQTFVEYALVMLLVGITLVALFAGAVPSVENALEDITEAIASLG